MTDRHVTDALINDTLDDFRRLPLPLRMREAAKVLREADQRRYPDYHQGNEYGWYPRELEGVADRFEREDKEAEHRAKAEQDAMVEKLYADLLKVWTDESPSALARRLVEAGWRKGGSDA